MDTSHLLVIIVFAVLLIPGVVMSLMPGLPGLLYMFFVVLIFGFIDQFTNLTLGNIGILAIITAVAMLVDLTSGIIGAKWGGAHWSSLIYGAIGLVVGAFVIPIPIVGSIVGLFLAILVAEWCRTLSFRKANKAALGGFAGSLVGIISNGTAAVAILTLFIIFAWS